MPKTRILYIDADEPTENDHFHQYVLEKRTNFYYDMFHTSSEALVSLDCRDYSGLFVGNLNIPSTTYSERSKENGKEVIREAKKRNLKTIVLLNEKSQRTVEELLGLGVDVIIENPMEMPYNYVKAARELFDKKLAE